VGWSEDIARRNKRPRTESSDGRATGVEVLGKAEVGVTNVSSAGLCDKEKAGQCGGMRETGKCGEKVTEELPSPGRLAAV